MLRGWQINVAEMMFRGMSDEQIAIAQFKVDKEDKRAMANAKQKISRLKKKEEFQEYYRALIQEWTVSHVGAALTKLGEQLNETNGWLVNKACNDILNQSKTFMGTDENTVVVKVEGMPELGTPDE